MLRAPVLSTKKLVIGYSLEALKFADEESAFLIVNKDQRPHFLEDSERLKEWNYLSFKLGVSGLTPIPSLVETIRISDQSAHVATEFYRKIQINFEELYIFDMDKVEGINVEEIVSEYVVYDWFDIKRGAKQPSCKILTPTRFLNEIIFYPSLRRDGNRGDIKDCYAKSYIEATRIHEFETSETSARLGTLAAIKRVGLRGPARQVGEKVYYLNLVLEHNRRDVYVNKKKYTEGEALPAYIVCCNVHS